jgi:hypothetical protein
MGRVAQMLSKRQEPCLFGVLSTIKSVRVQTLGFEMEGGREEDALALASLWVRSTGAGLSPYLV